MKKYNDIDGAQVYIFVIENINIVIGVNINQQWFIQIAETILKFKNTKEAIDFLHTLNQIRNDVLILK
jgi:hypothetical protein